MQLRMKKNSLFALLLRSAWWYSVLIGGALIGLAFVTLPQSFRLYGIALAIPFFCIAFVACYRQLRQPSTRQTTATSRWVQSARPRELINALMEAYAGAGYESTPHNGNGADFQLRSNGQITLISAKRAKAARTNIQPLRLLATAGEQAEADALIFVALGELTTDARAFAEKHRIELLENEGLITLLARHASKTN
tara:strand:- start:751 stop:1335 length:585 start_codon:yes stop_codon:yes gene_type:complete